jgi:hypothetical protein
LRVSCADRIFALISWGGAMPDGDSIAELTVYSFAQEAFRDGDGKALTGLPAVLEDLHSYWQSRRGDRPFPARADIDPVDIPSLLEHLMLVDVLYDPLDLRYRLVGGHIVAHAARNVQGHTVRGLMAEGSPQEQALQEKIMVAGQAVVQMRAPVCLDLTYRSVTSDSRKRLQAVLLPLGPSAAELNMLLGGIHFLA